MGYQVYKDGDRWAGYGVPAECDFPTCRAKIDRGIAYKCEEYTDYRYELNGVPIEAPDSLVEGDGVEEIEEEREGCGLFFCDQHQHHPEHEGSTPKPDSLEWMRHMMSDASWQQWRNENPSEVNRIAALLEEEK